ncbi:DNA polymerase subunit Cdc27 [Scheffersomyces coipomensis]|uniref:DNA polymerase subunit Cdc27 n=1 Tax=Scheffersomyces coipomensis TaxID=1788519 RepID=UPI00315D8FEC
MTMNASQAEVEYLSSQLFEKGKLVTYKTLSRALNVHINHSKLVLFEFYERNKSKLSAKLVITGKDNTGTLIKFIDDESEEVVKSHLNSFTVEINTIQVYSINPKDLILDQSNHNEIIQQSREFPIDLANLDKYYHNGLIKGPKVVPVEQSTIKQNYIPPPTTNTNTTTTKSIKKEEPKIKSSGLSSAYVSRKEKPAARSNTLSNYTSRKAENAGTKRSSTEPSSGGYQYKSRKVESKQPKERIIVSSHNDDDDDEDEDVEEVEEVDVEEVKPIKSTQIQDLFANEEWSDFEEDAPAKDEPIVVEEEIVKKKPVEKAESDKDPQQQEQPNEANVEESQNAPEQPQQEEDMTTEYDEDGYIITKKKKPIAKPAPSRNVKRMISPPPTTSKSKKSKDGKNQSILSFFGKNK